AGGQLPVFMRVGKKGFNNKNFKKVFSIITLNEVQKLVDAKQVKDSVTLETLTNAKFFKNPRGPLKVLGNGEIKSALKFEVTSITASAKDKIEKAGGSVKMLEVLTKKATSKKTKRAK
ncbi:MAG: uL15 family ribosomal protein, partial [Rickettsiales bacterium]|nr:uL15 family ribosomal protein [Rickettsiales bacterium]